MKRILIAMVGTVVGLVALLSFKTHQTPELQALPSAGLSAGSSSTAAPTAASTPTPTSAAPPNPDTSSPSTPTAPATAKAPTAVSTPTATTKTIAGQAVQTRYGVVQVQIVVVQTTIQNISFLQLTSDDPRSQEINNQAGPILLQETLTAQNANIDTVSGATYTSDGYLQSLQSALDQAGIK